MSTTSGKIRPWGVTRCWTLATWLASLPGCSATGALPAAEGLPAEMTRAFAYDPAEPLDLRVGSRTEVEGAAAVRSGAAEPSRVERLDLSYASPRGGRVPAWLYRPEGPGPHPAIVLQHGMPGSRNTNAELAAEYARAGAVVLTPTAPFGRPDAVHRAPSFVTAPLFDERDRSELVQTVVDLRRAVDLLRGRDDVDPERIAYVGISYGGWAGAVLAGVERRIAAYALVVAPTSLAARFRSRPTGLVGRVWDEVTPADREAWRETMAEVDGRRFVGFASPARLLFQIATEDGQVPPDDAASLAAAGSEPKTVLRYDADHALIPAAFRDQAEWLGEILGLEVDDFVALGRDPHLLKCPLDEVSTQSDAPRPLERGDAALFDTRPFA